MTKIEKKDVLIIEDSIAVGIALRNFLKKLYYQNIHICKDGTSGIKKFEEIVSSTSSPIVFLDYKLPDMSGLSVFTQLLARRPEVKVIIETAAEKGEDSIKDLIRQGVYHYLQKPIRFEEVKEIMVILEGEEHIVESKSEDVEEKIETLLKSYTEISLERLSEYTQAESQQVLSYLKKLESAGKVMRLKEKREISCDSCGSLKVTQNYHCPSCNSSNFKQGKLLEHYECGNVSLADTYQNDTCPKCKKKIKALGVDYRKMENYYICNECDDKFSEVPFDLLCLKCNNKFKLQEAVWKISPDFSLPRS